MENSSPKPFYQSKTMWVNAVAVMIGVAALFGVDVSTAIDAAPVVQNVDPQVATDVAVSGGILGAINMALRAVTDSAVAFKKSVAEVKAA